MKRQRSVEDNGAECTSADVGNDDEEMKVALMREHIDPDVLNVKNAAKARAEEAAFVASVGEALDEPFWSHSSTETDRTPTDASSPKNKNKNKKKKRSRKSPEDEKSSPVSVRVFSEEELAAAREAESNSFDALEDLVNVFQQKKPRKIHTYGDGPVTFVSRIVKEDPKPSEVKVEQVDSTEMTDKPEQKQQTEENIASSSEPKEDDSTQKIEVTQNTFTFVHEDELPEVLSHEQVEPPYPDVPVCVITGARAKYKDPVSGRPFSDLQSGKVLRRQVNTPEEVTIEQRLVELAVALERKKIQYDSIVAEFTYQQRQLLAQQQHRQQQQHHQQQQQQQLQQQQLQSQQQRR